MNYTTITINDEKVGLKFGMASLRYLTKYLSDDFTNDENDLNEIGIAHILYSGYYNNCVVKLQKPSYTFENFVDWIEENQQNDSVKEEIKEAISVWSQNEYIKQTQIEEGNKSKKKTYRGKK